MLSARRRERHEAGARNDRALTSAFDATTASVTEA